MTPWGQDVKPVRIGVIGCGSISTHYLALAGRAFQTRTVGSGPNEGAVVPVQVNTHLSGNRTAATARWRSTPWRLAALDRSATERAQVAIESRPNRPAPLAAAPS